jgi:hypothetical protein
MPDVLQLLIEERERLNRAIGILQGELRPPRPSTRTPRPRKAAQEVGDPSPATDVCSRSQVGVGANEGLLGRPPEGEDERREAIQTIKA